MACAGYLGHPFGKRRALRMLRAFLLKIRQKSIHSRLCYLILVIFGDQCDSEAQLFEPPDGPTLGRLGGLFVGMTRSQFAVGLLFASAGDR
jgi:hypothetical protein